MMSSIDKPPNILLLKCSDVNQARVGMGEAHEVIKVVIGNSYLMEMLSWKVIVSQEHSMGDTWSIFQVFGKKLKCYSNSGRYTTLPLENGQWIVIDHHP